MQGKILILLLLRRLCELFFSSFGTGQIIAFNHSIGAIFFKHTDIT